jgi:hypothetical protein
VTDHSRNLRLDLRLIRRRGWISPEDLQRELDALPDASDKIQPPEEEADESEAPGKPPGSEDGSAGPASGA